MAQVPEDYRRPQPMVRDGAWRDHIEVAEGATALIQQTH